jgi:hypothetical protein
MASVHNHTLIQTKLQQLTGTGNTVPVSATNNASNGSPPPRGLHCYDSFVSTFSDNRPPKTINRCYSSDFVRPRSINSPCRRFHLRLSPVCAQPSPLSAPNITIRAWLQQRPSSEQLLCLLRFPSRVPFAASLFVPVSPTAAAPSFNAAGNTQFCE